jgi:hypothetical protein
MVRAIRGADSTGSQVNIHIIWLSNRYLAIYSVSAVIGGKGAYSASQSTDALRDLWYISSLVEIYCLENIDVWDAVVSDSALKFVDILHHLELTPSCVHFCNRPGLQFVHQSG